MASSGIRTSVNAVKWIMRAPKTSAAPLTDRPLIRTSKPSSQVVNELVSASARTSRDGENSASLQACRAARAVWHCASCRQDIYAPSLGQGGR